MSVKSLFNLAPSEDWKCGWGGMRLEREDFTLRLSSSGEMTLEQGCFSLSVTVDDFLDFDYLTIAEALIASLEAFETHLGANYEQ